MLASVDARDDAVSLYAWRDGGFVRLGSLATGRLPAQIVAADLNGDGWTDLVVRNAGDGTLSVFFGSQVHGSRQSLRPLLLSFLAPVTLPVGLGVSDVQAVDTTGSGRLDLVVTNKLTGQVSILRNLGNGTFAPPEPYRAGTGLSAIDTSSGSPVVTSLEATAGVAAGPFTPGGPTDLVTINPGSNTLGLLAGLGAAGSPTPSPSRPSTPRRSSAWPTSITTASRTWPSSPPSGVSIYLGNGKGGFSPPGHLRRRPRSHRPDRRRRQLATASPTSWSATPTATSWSSLGNGDGTFQPYRKADQAVALAVADLTGDGKPDFIYANQGLDRVVVEYGSRPDHRAGRPAPPACSPPAPSSWPT